MDEERYSDTNEDVDMADKDNVAPTSLSHGQVQGGENDSIGEDKETQIDEAMKSIFQDPNVNPEKGTLKSFMKLLKKRLGWNVKPYKKLVEQKITEYPVSQSTHDSSQDEEGETQQSDRDSQGSDSNEKEQDVEMNDAEETNEKEEEETENTVNSGRVPRRLKKKAKAVSDSEESKEETDQASDTEGVVSSNKSKTKARSNSDEIDEETAAEVSGVNKSHKARTDSDDTDDDDDDEKMQLTPSEKENTDASETVTTGKSKTTRSRKQSQKMKRATAEDTEDETDHPLKELECLGRDALEQDLNRVETAIGLEEALSTKTTSSLSKLSKQLIALTDFGKPVEDLDDNTKEQVKEVILQCQVSLPLDYDQVLEKSSTCIKYFNFIELLRAGSKLQIMKKRKPPSLRQFRQNSIISLEPSGSVFSGEVSDLIEAQCCLEDDFKIDVEKVFDCISLEKPNLWDQFSLMRLAAKSLVSRDRRNENSSVSPHTGLESLKWPLRWLWVPVPVSALPAFLTSGAKLFPRLRMCDAFSGNFGPSLWELCLPAWKFLPFNYKKDQRVALILCEVFTGIAYSPFAAKTDEKFHSIVRYGRKVVSVDSYRPLLRSAEKPELESVCGVGEGQSFEDIIEESSDNESTYLKEQDQYPLDGTMYSVRDTKQILPVSVVIAKITEN